MNRWKEMIGKIGRDRILILTIGGLLLLVVTIPADRFFQSRSNSLQEEVGKQPKVVENVDRGCTSDENYMKYKYALESQLESVLRLIEGVGDVKVIISLKDAGSVIVEKDLDYATKKETKNATDDLSNVLDTDSKESTVYTVDEYGNEVPLITKQILPSIEGILVVTKGGNNASVKKEIREAVLSLFPLDEHKIAIVKMKNES